MTIDEKQEGEKGDEYKETKTNGKQLLVVKKEDIVKINNDRSIFSKNVQR